MSSERMLRKNVATTTDTRDALADSLAKVEGELVEAREQLAVQPDASELQTKFELAVEEARDLRAENAELEEKLTSLRNSESRDPNELADLKHERDSLLQQVRDLESQNPGNTNESQQQEHDDLRQRFEMAVEDVRQLKTEKEELEQKLAEQRQADQSRSGSADGLDWESVRSRLMESLEEDFDPNCEEEQQEKTTIEGTIRITDDIIAEKENEIVELKRLLENQSESIGEVAVGAGPVAELFDQDESIREERTPCRAAVGIGRQTAGNRTGALRTTSKISRERTELEKKQQDLEELHAEIKDAANAIPTKDFASRKRRWLARLGLNKEGEE